MSSASAACLARCLVCCLAAVVPSAAAPVAGADAPHWRHARSVAPSRAVPGAFGPAIDCDGGALWIGPARDRDAGVGPARVTHLRIKAGFGLPGGPAEMVARPDGLLNTGFGLSLAAARGACVAGSPHAGCRSGGCDAGQAHLLRRDRDGTWIAEEIACPDAEPAAEFGAAVATDGRTIVIGSPRADAGAHDGGAVDVFECTDPGGEVRFVARITPPNPTMSGRFGASVAVDGGWIAVGEPGAGPSLPRAGIVHLLRRDAGEWRIQESLRAPAGAVGWHGASVALAGCDLLAGAPVARTDSGRSAAGAATWWRLEDGQWRLRACLAAPDGRPGDGFGSSVAIDGGWAAVGSPGDDRDGEDSGCAWAFELGGGPGERVAPRSPEQGRGFGSCVRFGDAEGSVRAGPDRFLAVASLQDPEQPLAPGTVELFAYVADPPLLLASPGAVQSRSASAMASAAEASVTTAGRQPPSCRRASAASP